MTKFQIEPGLPPYGPSALCFPDPEAFSEGLVVTFTTSTGERWTGNFARGHGSIDTVRDELGPRATVVIAGGTAYRLDVDSKTASEITWPAEYIAYVANHNVMIIGNGLWFEAFGPSGAIWRSRRIAWDGMRSVQNNGQEIHGEAYSPVGPPDWLPFKLDLASGDAEGGSYDGPA